MIKYTPEQFNKCLEIYMHADSTIAGAYEMLRVLQLNEDEISGEDWCEFTRQLCCAANTSAFIEAQKPHHDCGCADSPYNQGTCTCHSKPSLPPNVSRMYELCDNVASTYARKNADYGDSFHTSVTKYGIIAALTRMSDKWNRLENLMLHGNGLEVQ